MFNPIKTWDIVRALIITSLSRKNTHGRKEYWSDKNTKNK
jgi:hypothetical protein